MAIDPTNPYDNVIANLDQIEATITNPLNIFKYDILWQVDAVLIDLLAALDATKTTLPPEFLEIIKRSK
jgi:hypothetical protein